MLTHMPPTATDTRTAQHIAQDRVLDLLGLPSLRWHVEASRGQGHGWDRVAQSVHKLTDVPVSGRALAEWFAEPEETPA